MAYGTNNPVSITNSTLTGNSATTDGSAIFTYAPVALSFSTIANNTGAPALGFSGGSATVVGDILDNVSNCDVGSVPDDGFNLTFQGGACGLTGGSDVQGQDPLLGSLADNGGPTHTLAPSPDSPAIGAATTCNDVSNQPVATDQRGASRPSTHCTVGAYEADGANGTWVNAQLLNGTGGGYQVNQTETQHIYTTGAERWYKFAVTPGSTVQIQYSGLPGAVVSLHSNVQAEYGAITSPTNTAISSAQNAQSGFLPQQFLPQQFLPQQFLPQQFLPQQFLPQQFLPQQFLPQQFLPQQFLPQQFLPQQFLPQQFLPAPYSGAAYASLLAASAVPNSSVQTITRNTWNTFSTWYVRVSAPASLSTPFTLTVTETGGVCTGVTAPDFTAPAPSSSATGLTSLLLWDPTRIGGSSADVSTLDGKLSDFAKRQEVSGTVVDLSTFAGISSAQTQADANPACPTAKNIVAADIKSVIQSYRTQNPGLKYIVLVGDDHSIPYFRYPDESGLGTENQYYPPVADNSSANSSLRDNFILGQDEYGSSADLTLGDLSLPIPDLAVGRLVKTPAEISHLLDVYTNSGGVLAPSSSLVTGYDFVADAATNAATDLREGIGAAPDTLISSSWNASDLRQHLFSGRHDIIFMAGHFSAGALEAADYSTSLSSAEVAGSSVDMSNSLVLALGCHGGYTIPSGDGIPGLSPAPDWTEALAEKGATLLASTGYAYGDTVLTEYGEHLFDNVVHQLLYGSGAVPVGQAEVAAKKEYLATHTNLTGVDEKTLLETTLYGLPMTGVDMPHGRTSAPTDSSSVPSTSPVSGPGQALSLTSYDLDVTPSLTTNTTTLTNSAGGQVTATYLTGPNGSEVARPGEPIFPSQSYDVQVPNLILRGVGFRGGAYTDLPNTTPLTSAVGTETSVGHPAFYTNVFYPTQVGAANFFGAIGGGAEHLDTTPAQYISSSPTSTSGTLRKYSDLQFRLFYLPHSWNTDPTISPAAEAAPSQITAVSATADGSGSVRFSVHVSSDQTAGTQAVWITYTDPGNPGTWTSIDLTQSTDDPTLWTATQSGLPSDIEFMVQAANGAGLVTLSTNSGAYYTTGAPSSTTTPTTITVTSGPANGVFQSQSSPFQVHLDAGGAGLAGQAVTLLVGSQEALGTTDANGNATLSVPLDEPPGSYNAVATYAGATAGNSTYLASSSNASSFAITPAPTTLTMASSGQTVHDPTAISATLTDGSGNPLVQRTVLFTLTSGGQSFGQTAITDLNGRALLGSLSLPNGSYSVTAAFGGADQPQTLNTGGASVTESDPDYLTSTASGVTLAFNLPQTISFDLSGLPTKTYGDPSFSVASYATGGASGNPVTFTVSGKCTNSDPNGATITITGAGSCTVTANQAGNSTYAAAAPVSQTFSIQKAPQSISFAALPTQYVASPPITLTAAASSGLPVTYTATGQCSVSGNSASIIGAGSCTITASQAGDANYNPASPVQQTITIKLAPGLVYALDALAPRTLASNGQACLTASGSIYVNSSASDAIYQAGQGCANGHAFNVTSGGTINVVGGFASSCCAPTPTHLASAVADPLASVAMPTYSSTTGWSSPYGSLSARTVPPSGGTLQPGVYPGGINLSSGSFTMSPGVYVLDGGGLTISGSAALRGSGVFIYNSNHSNPAGCSAIQMSGTGNVSLNAMSSGPYAQILLAEDRACSAGAGLSGGSNLALSGAFYLPRAALALTGQSSAILSSQGILIADTVTLSGQASIHL
jgi:hypothetical protein